MKTPEIRNSSFSKAKTVTNSFLDFSQLGLNLWISSHFSKLAFESNLLR